MAWDLRSFLELLMAHASPPMGCNRPLEEELPPSIIVLAEEHKVQFQESHGEGIEAHIVLDRYGEADKFAFEALNNKAVKRGMADRISDQTLRPFSGTIIPIAVMGRPFLTPAYMGVFIGDLIIRTYVASTTSLTLALAIL